MTTERDPTQRMLLLIGGNFLIGRAVFDEDARYVALQRPAIFVRVPILPAPNVLAFVESCQRLPLDELRVRVDQVQASSLLEDEHPWARAYRDADEPGARVQRVR